jgi:hypothetical protein
MWMIIMDNGYQNKIIKFTKKLSYCHMFNFDEWMKNDVNMTL